ncbi:MAG TPA: amino acid-binding protein [Arthrobacter sp.]|nr:amino acid-binding protein [Arthrobacter sp.]
MTRHRHPAHALACDSCGQLPHPAKARLTLANVAAMLPIELVVHAAVVHTAMPYLLKVLVLTLTATVMVIWVAEPSVRIALRGWLHESAALWRVRTLIDDDPDGQEKLAEGVSGAGAEILVCRSHHVTGGLLDELVVAAPDHLTHADLIAAAGAGGGRDVRAWPATALAVADGQTKALALALRVAEDPDELQFAVAELLDAQPVSNPSNPSGDCTGARDGAPASDGTLLKVPSPWHGPLGFSRPEAPFTPAESARAHRLAELAELTELTRSRTVRPLP